MNRFILGAYWSDRQESIDQCADRLLKFFADLTSCDPSMARWFKLGRSRKQALQHQVDVTDREVLLKLLDCGRSWTDFDKRLVEDLGFSVALWNGGDSGTAAQLTLTCGLYSKCTLLNNVVILLPHALGSLAISGRMRGVLAAAANAWEPDWTGIMSDDARVKREFRAREPFVDWMLYISRQWLPTVPVLTPPASTESLDSGTLIIVQNEVPDPTNKNHLENIRRVETALRSVWRAPKDEPTMM